MRVRILGLAASALIIVGCGDAADEDPVDSAETEAEATVEDFYAAVVDGDLEAHCALLTDNGRMLYDLGNGKNLCDRKQGTVGAGSMPQIGPVGADQDVALAGITYVDAKGEFVEGYVAVLRRVDGQWLVDLPQPYPVPESVDSAEYPEAMIQSLPNEGEAADAVRDVATQYSEAVGGGDGAGACALLTDAALERSKQPNPALDQLPAAAGVTNCERIYTAIGSTDGTRDVVDVAVVGDVALAYRSAGDGPAARPSQALGGEQLDILLLENSDVGWRVNPTTLGYG